MIRIQMSKTNYVYEGNYAYPVIEGSVSKVVAKVLGCSQDEIKVTWQIYSGAPVSVEKQNSVFLRRAAKIASATGRTVESFNQILGDNYECTLTP